jgi:hypothetical protein
LLACRGIAEKYAEAVERRMEKVAETEEAGYEGLAEVLRVVAEEVIPASVTARGPARVSDVAASLARERDALYREAAAANRLREPEVREALRVLRRKLRSRRCKDRWREMSAVADSEAAAA